MQIHLWDALEMCLLVAIHGRFNYTFDGYLNPSMDEFGSLF